MPKVSRHPIGAPCWFELGTTDQESAKSFYSELFGWSPTDTPIGGDQFYSMFQKGGRDVCAAYTLVPGLTPEPVPPHWMVYFASDNVDDCASKVIQAGGEVRQAPYDVFDQGRLAVCKDPTGALFSLWQARKHCGAGVIDEDCAVCWTELATCDVPRARDFYCKLFGWTTRPSRGTPAYIEFAAGGQNRGGLLPMDKDWEGVAPHWGIYFLVPDVDLAAARAKELGGVTRYGPFDAPSVGRMAALSDPQGAGFSLITFQIAA